MTTQTITKGTKISTIVKLALELQSEIDKSPSTIGTTPDLNLWQGESEYFPISKDLRCNCGCNQAAVSNYLYNKMVQARTSAGIPFNISSWNRCTDYNAIVGGSFDSSHIKGLAVDIYCGTSTERFTILQALILAGFDRIGIYSWGIHVDVDLSKPADVCWYDHPTLAN